MNTHVWGKQIERMNLENCVFTTRLPRAADRARQTRSFVRVQHWSTAAACGCKSKLFLRHKTVSTEKAQHTEIPLPRDKEPLRFGSVRAKFVRGSVRSAAHGNMVSTLRDRARNIASRGSRAQSIPGYDPTALVMRDRRYVELVNTQLKNNALH
jgi:hypothetical protein